MTSPPSAELEAEFAALERVLPFSESGELRWPDAEDGAEVFLAFARAVAKLGWLGNDGVPEPPPPVSEVDSFLIGYGRWLDSDVADTEAHVLAASIVRAEVELRAEQWSALELILGYVDTTGRIAWPVEPGPHARLFEALDRLRWRLAPAGGTPGTPSDDGRSADPG